jgi:uncharacterized protein (TIGR02611 family)
MNPDIANREGAAEQNDLPPEQDDDGAPLRHPFRQFFARHRTLDLTYRIVVAAIGSAVVIGGIALIPLPGPGWLIVFGGLAILATEFEWAGRLLDFARRKVRGWTHWVGRQSLLVRGLIGLVGLLFVGGLMWAYVAVQGVPTWLPLL